MKRIVTVQRLKTFFIKISYTRYQRWLNIYTWKYSNPLTHDFEEPGWLGLPHDADQIDGDSDEGDEHGHADDQRVDVEGQQHQEQDDQDEQDGDAEAHLRNNDKIGSIEVAILWCPSTKNTIGGWVHNTMVSILASGPSCPRYDSQWLETFDQTHLVLAIGKLFLQNRLPFVVPTNHYAYNDQAFCFVTHPTASL